MPLAQATKKETTPPPSAIASRKVEEEKPSFVFGQNLKDRCEFSNVDEADKKATSTEETTKKPAAETPAEDKKTLQESAEDYCNLHAKVVSVPEVEITTGEENETNVFHMSAKVNLFFLQLKRILKTVLFSSTSLTKINHPGKNEVAANYD